MVTKLSEQPKNYCVLLSYTIEKYIFNQLLW